MAYIYRIVFSCCLFFLPISLQAAIINFSNQSTVVSPSPGGGLNFTQIPGNTSGSASRGGSNINIPFTFDVPSGKGIVPVPGTRTTSFDVPRIGGAVANAGRTLGPAGVGIGLATLICQETNICDDLFDDWEIASPEIQELSGAVNCHVLSPGVIHYHPATNTSFALGPHPVVCPLSSGPSGFQATATCPIGDFGTGCFTSTMWSRIETTPLQLSISKIFDVNIGVLNHNN